ncbi:uncharacterized protein Hap1MRO34_006170 [Clarias gariepinus]
MVLLRILRWLLRPVSRLLYALFALVWPRRRAEREEPLTQRGNNIHLTQRGNTKQRSHSQAVIEELQMVRDQLETKLEEKKKIENQLWDTENTVTALQEKGHHKTTRTPKDLSGGERASSPKSSGHKLFKLASRDWESSCPAKAEAEPLKENLRIRAAECVT